MLFKRKDDIREESSFTSSIHFIIFFLVYFRGKDKNIISFVRKITREIIPFLFDIFDVKKCLSYKAEKKIDLEWII